MKRQAADHPHTDPGDGRVQCETCGKFVHLVTHSCKGVRVARAVPVVHPEPGDRARRTKWTSRHAVMQMGGHSRDEFVTDAMALADDEIADAVAAAVAAVRADLAAKVEADAIERWGTLPLATEVAAALIRGRSRTVSGQVDEAGREATT